MRSDYPSYEEMNERGTRVERPRSSSRRRTSDDTEKNKTVKIVNTKLLNVRSTSENAGTGNIIGQLKSGEKVVTFGKEGEYYRIKHGKVDAYILSKFCEEI